MTAACKHTPCPDGYLQWHAWAKAKAKTHKQERCPTCGLWTIWKLKPVVAALHQAANKADQG